MRNEMSQMQVSKMAAVENPQEVAGKDIDLDAANQHLTATKTGAGIHLDAREPSTGSSQADVVENNSICSLIGGADDVTSKPPGDACVPAEYVELTCASSSSSLCNHVGALNSVTKLPSSDLQSISSSELVVSATNVDTGRTEAGAPPVAAGANVNNTDPGAVSQQTSVAVVSNASETSFNVASQSVSTVKGVISVQSTETGAPQGESVPAIRTNTTAVTVNMVLPAAVAPSAAPRTLAPRIVPSMSPATTVLRVQTAPGNVTTQTIPSQQLILPVRNQATTVPRNVLPGGIQVAPNMFFLRNDQGQVMLMTGQPQAVPTAAGNEVRLQQPAGTAVFRPVSAVPVTTSVVSNTSQPVQPGSAAVQLITQQQPSVSSAAVPPVVLSQSAIAARLVQPPVPILPPAVTASNASPAAGSLPPSSTASKDMLDNVRKCKNFLSTLLKLASNQPATTVQNVKALIQGLVDGKVEPEDFTSRLQKELKSSPQPYLVPFLKKSLPLLRHSLSMNKMHIDGVRPPLPMSVLSPVLSSSAASAPSRAVSTSSSLAAQPVASIALVQQPTAAGVNITPRTAAVTQQTLPFSASVGGRPVIPNLAGLTPQQRQALLAQQQRFMVTSDVRRMLIRPPSSGVILPPGRIMLTSNGPASLMPGVSGRLPGVATTSSGMSVTVPPTPVTHRLPEKRKYDALRDNDDINDVATMGGVNLVEESRNILTANAGVVLGQLRSCKDESFLDNAPLAGRISAIAQRHGLQSSVNSDVVRLVSHATQERLRTVLEKLAIIVEHRQETFKADPRYETSTSVKSQIKFLEELDSLERKRHEEVQRGVLLRAAKSRAKPEDPEQAKLKEKAKALQLAEIEELRQREANMTALAAIGPRKQRRLDTPSSVGASHDHTASPVSNRSMPVAALRPRVKRVCLKDVLFLLEHEHSSSKSTLLYKAFVK